jgi:hypothetical protein
MVGQSSDSAISKSYKVVFGVYSSSSTVTALPRLRHRQIRLGRRTPDKARRQGPILRHASISGATLPELRAKAAVAP